MKKLISILLTLVLIVSLAACVAKVDEVVVDDKDTVVEETVNNDATVEEDVEVKPEQKPVEKEEVKPETKPEVKPEVKPEQKPAEEVKPEPTPSTLGYTLLADFKAKASGKSAQEIADALLTNPAIKFAGGAIPVEEGYLTGFDDVEIKGFKEGVMFAPMIGTIPFVGYIFELADGTDANGFVSTLRDNANLRWNICTSADEMVTFVLGNKVFFVMCPESLEE